MCVQQSVDILPVDNTDLPTEDSKMVEVPRGLKQRWKPFGWSEHSTLTNHEYKSGNLAWVINMHVKPLWQLSRLFINVQGYAVVKHGFTR